MYYEEIEKWTRSTLISHLPLLLAEEMDSHPDSLVLTMPVSFDMSSVIGGVTRVARDTLPQYAVECATKRLDATGEDIPTYIYTGTLTLMIGDVSPARVDAITKRHATCVEKWINSHLNPFPIGDDVETNYWIQEMSFAYSAFSGAMPMEQSASNQQDVEFWVSGVELGLLWRVAEVAPHNG